MSSARTSSLAEQNSSWAAPRRELFCQILLPWWGERYEKKSKFNDALAIIVVAQQNSWRLADSRAKDFRAVFPTLIFATFLLRWWEACVAPRREMSGARTSALNVPLLSRCSSVVRWAVLGKFCYPGEVSGTWKSQNSIMHWPLFDQPSKKDARLVVISQVSGAWNSHTDKVQQCTYHCGSLRQRLSSCAPGVNFFSKFCCRGEVSGTWKGHSSTMHVPLLSYESKTAGRLVDRCANDSRAAPRREFFAKFCCRGEGSGTWKFSNARAIIFPSWGKWCVKQSKLNT